MSALIKLGDKVRVAIEGRVVARDEMGDNGYLVEHDGKQDWIPPEIVERVPEQDGGGI